ncbi:MAG: phytoene desaturase family protein [Alphaproteobacteria bacterium]|nr:phytoene desaturase family protein [Alphaproteobacteria bacterium]
MATDIDPIGPCGPAINAPTSGSSARAESDRRPHAVIIGSGFGGLAAALRLLARGFRVTVLERLDRPGGRGRVFKQDGYTFDAGPTIITAPFLLHELWELFGRRLEDDVTLKALNPFYKIRFADGDEMAFSDDPEAMRREVMRVAPDDLGGYERFFKSSEEIFRYGFMKLGFQPFSTLGSMAKATPKLLKLGAYWSVYQYISRYVKSEKLRIAMSFHPLFIGGNPFSVTSTYCLINFMEREWGVHFVMGGTGALVDAMVKLIREEGGSLHFDSEVARIRLDGKKANGVVLASGEEIDADLVVSNADMAWTYRKLLPENAKGRWTGRKSVKSRYSMGLFIWYFGTNRRYDHVAHHSILLGPRYKGLLVDIFKKKKLAADFSLYLYRPTATDPSLAPEGGDAFYALSPVPNLLGDTDWTEQAETYRQGIADYLEETLMPGLQDAVVTERVQTPLDFRDQLLSYHGAGFGLEPVIHQSAWFRPHNKSEDFENLYLVGAGTHPGAGVPGVICSARILDDVVPDPTFFLREKAAS